MKVLSCLLASLLISCTGKDRIVVIYSPHGKEMLSHFERLYEEEFPEVDVQWLDMGSQDVLDRIRTERSNPQADLWWGAPSLLFARAEAESLLERYIPTWDSAVSKEVKSPHGFWNATFTSPEVIVYNTNLLRRDEAPQDWDALLDEQWRGRILIRYPLASGTMRTILGAIIQREIRNGGSEEDAFSWLRRLDANTKSYAADPTQLYLKLARGEGAVTLWNLPDILMQVRINGYPFGYVIPASGTPLITDGIAIVRNARHRAEAVRLYEFLTSRRSLLSQAEMFGRIPVRHDIPREEKPAWLQELTLSELPVEWTMLFSRESEWMRRWENEVRGKGE